MRVLVAGVGNLFYSDDAFGVEVARRLALEPPADTKVTDFGIRARHLAYELLEPWQLCVVADCMPRGGKPGTLYVIEPEVTGVDASVANAHALDLPTVFAAVRELGGRLPRTLVVGCEPDVVEPGIGLSPSIAAAIPAAIQLIRDLIHPEETPP